MSCPHSREIYPLIYCHNGELYILTSSLQTLLNRQPASSRSHIALFGSFDPSLASSYNPNKGRAIDDPYYGGRDGFDKCYEQCIVYADGFLDFVERGGQ